MKTPELRRRTRAWFKTLRETRGDDPTHDDAVCTVSAAEVVTFAQELLAKLEQPADTDDEAFRGQVASALAELFALIEDGRLVRNIARDHEPGWAGRVTELVLVLRRAFEAVDRARARVDSLAEEARAGRREHGRRVVRDGDRAPEPEKAKAFRDPLHTASDVADRELIDAEPD